MWTSGRTPHLTSLPSEPYPNLAVIANKKSSVIIPIFFTEVIEAGFSVRSRYGRIGKAKGYKFEQKRLNGCHEEKRVEVFYTIEGNKAVIVAV